MALLTIRFNFRRWTSWRPLWRRPGRYRYVPWAPAWDGCGTVAPWPCDFSWGKVEQQHGYMVYNGYKNMGIWLNVPIFHITQPLGINGLYYNGYYNWGDVQYTQNGTLTNPWKIWQLGLPQMLHGAGIFTDIYPKNGPNVGKYSIHRASGYPIYDKFDS